MVYGAGGSYEGEWFNDQRHGRGKLIDKNGKVWEGEWILDQQKL